MTPDEMRARLSSLEDKMRDRLYINAPDLRRLLIAARGRLPRRILRRAQELMEFEARLAHPAMAATTDAARFRETCAIVEDALRSVPDGKYRRRQWWGTTGLVAVRVLTVLAALSTFLWWKSSL